MSVLTEHPTKITGALVAGLGFIQAYPELPKLLGPTAYGWAMFVIGLLIVVLGFWNTHKANTTPVVPPSSHWLIGLFALLACTVMLSGCVTPPSKPIQTACNRAEPNFDIVRCSKTIGDTYEIYQKQALAIVQDPGTPEDARERVRRADAAMTPVLVELLRATRVYNGIRMDIAAGASEQEKLGIANTELLRWITEAEPVLERLIAAVGG